jgi:hypothetical protein
VEQQAGTQYKFSDTDKCPLCHQTDGGGHIASGQDPIMKRMYTERHNKAGRILLDAIYGARGSDICMADGSQQRCERRGAPTSASTTCPPRCSPQAPGNRGARPVAAHQAARHHALQHARTLAGRQSAARHLHRGAQDLPHAADRPADGGATTTRELVERLVQRGYQRQDQDLHPTASAAPSTRRTITPRAAGGAAGCCPQLRQSCTPSWCSNSTLWSPPGGT